MEIKAKKEGTDDLLTGDDMLSMVENNRQRIRTFSNVIVTICGLLISSAFVIFFFIQDKQLAGQSLRLTSILMIIAILCLLGSLFFATLSVFAKPAVGMAKKSLVVLYYAKLYQIEQKRTFSAFISLMVGILVFAITLVLYAYQML